MPGKGYQMSVFKQINKIDCDGSYRVIENEQDSVNKYWFEGIFL